MVRNDCSDPYSEDGCVNSIRDYITTAGEFWFGKESVKLCKNEKGTSVSCPDNGNLPSTLSTRLFGERDLDIHLIDRLLNIHITSPEGENQEKFLIAHSRFKLFYSATLKHLCNPFILRKNIVVFKESRMTF